MKPKGYIPAREEEKDGVLKAVEKELAELQRSIRQPPALLKAMDRSPISQMGSIMNDTQLSDSIDFNNDVTKDTNKSLDTQEVFTRLAELEDNMPEFKGANSWDVPIPLLSPTATLADVVSTVNKIIQRTSRQDRLK